MNLILCHTTADFDALGAAVGLTRLLPGSKIVLPSGSHPHMRDFLALYRDEYPLIERRSVVPEEIRSLTVVDTQQRDRLGKAAEWLDLPSLKEVIVYDHHVEQHGNIPATQLHISSVGATTTLIVEQLKRAEISLTPAEATVMALGIHVDTGSLTFESTTPRDALALAWLMQQGVSLTVISQYLIPNPPTARDLMSSPVRSIRPETSIEEAQRILLRYGHSGLSVVNTQGQLVGIISRRDLDIALHHGFSHAPVKGYMTKNMKTITPETTLPEIELLMVTYDIGRLPVLENGQLVGIVTRTDVLRELHQGRGGAERAKGEKNIKFSILNELRSRLAPQLWQLLTQASQEAEKRGWHLYLVGGAVRDLLLAEKATGNLLIQDIDLVVDGFHQAADVGAGVSLAKALQRLYPNARLEIHGAFQTAALLWHKDPELESLWVDIATARTEFYPYPAANPEVEASSIRQDLYRRDFTINAMALRLTPPRAGELLDFFGGWQDLQVKQIRVLHANSFIEDPTRIYRGVRFAVRLGFELEAQTEEYIRYAINSGVYDRTARENAKAPALQTRLKAELKHILEAPYWKAALQLLGDLGALQCIHPTLKLNEELLRQLHLLERCLRRFDPENSLVHWQMRLEALIAHLSPEYRGMVAKNLQLPEDSIARLNKVAQAQDNVKKLTLTSAQNGVIEEVRPSQVVQLLQRYDLPMLILIAVQSPRPVRRQIWQYLTVWSKIQPILDGNDLRKLGYRPGPQYRQILDDLRKATLDGVIGDYIQAEGFLAKHYPL